MNKLSVKLTLFLLLAACASEDTLAIGSDVGGSATDSQDSTDSGSVEDSGGSDEAGESTAGNCPWLGDVDLSDSAAVAAFAASGCDHVVGNVLLANSAVAELPRVPVRRVEGLVVIEGASNLQSLAGLESLSSADAVLVGAGLDWDGTSETEAPNLELRSLEGLQALQSATLVVVGNPSMVTLDGLDSLRFANSVFVISNSRLADVSALEGVEIGGEEASLVIADNDCLDQTLAERVLDARPGNVPLSAVDLSGNGSRCAAPTE